MPYTLRLTLDPFDVEVLLVSVYELYRTFRSGRGESHDFLP